MENRRILVGNHALRAIQIKHSHEKHKLRSHFLGKVASQKKLELFSQLPDRPLVFFIIKVCIRRLVENCLELTEPTEAPVRDGDIFSLSFF